VTEAVAAAAAATEQKVRSKSSILVGEKEGSGWTGLRRLG